MDPPVEQQFHSNTASFDALSVSALERRMADKMEAGEEIGRSRKLSAKSEKQAAPAKKKQTSWGYQPPAVDKEAEKELREERKQQQQDEDDAEKTRLLDQIEAYRARFKSLKKRNKCENMKASLAELHDEVHYIESQLGHKDGKEPVGMAFVACMYGLEYGFN